MWNFYFTLYSVYIKNTCVSSIDIEYFVKADRKTYGLNAGCTCSCAVTEISILNSVALNALAEAWHFWMVSSCHEYHLYYIQYLPSGDVKGRCTFLLISMKWSVLLCISFGFCIWLMYQSKQFIPCMEAALHRLPARNSKGVKSLLFRAVRRCVFKGGDFGSCSVGFIVRCFMFQIALLHSRRMGHLLWCNQL